MNKTCFYNARLVDANTDTLGMLLVAEGKIAAVLLGEFSAESAKSLAENFFADQETDVAINFIDCLFVDTSHISAEQGKAIRNHIHYMFDRLLLEGCNEEDWIVPVLRWLMSQPVTQV